MAHQTITDHPREDNSLQPSSPNQPTKGPDSTPTGMELSSAPTKPILLSQVLNKSTKWVVTSVVAGVVIWQRDNPAVLWAVSGAAINGANSRFLKRCFNHHRPTTAAGLKFDPGMPSSHAQSLAYLATYASIGLLSAGDAGAASATGAGVVLLAATYLAYLRVANGLHTVAQVVVGGGVGAATALFFSWAWNGFVARHLEPHIPWLTPTIFVAAAVLFLGYAAKNWRFSDL